MIEVLWTTALLDLPAATAPAAERFWCAFTGSTLSGRRGDRQQFATLLPEAGDPHLRMQRLDDGPRVHLDLHVPDAGSAAARVEQLGARVRQLEDGLVLLWSPAGIVGCLVSGAQESVRTLPVPLPGGGALLVDQLCLDVPTSAWDAEREFWPALTGWEIVGDPDLQLVPLRRPRDQPLRLLLQRVDTGGPGAHLDLAVAPHRAQAVEHAVSLGARVVRRHERWTVLQDPAGLAFCLTDRTPSDGFTGRG